MEEIKQSWKKGMQWLVIGITLIIVYKLLDNFVGVQEWFKNIFGIIKPFLIGLLISYILVLPCSKIEKALKSSNTKFLSKHARGISVFLTYLIFILIIIIIVTIVFPILKDSIVELISNIPRYYDEVVEKYNNLPEDSILKSDFIKEQVKTIEQLDIKQFVQVNNGQVLGYISNIINVFSGIFDICISFVISVYILLQRSTIVNALMRFVRAVLNKEKYETFKKYFTKGNEVFFTFLSSQIFDAFIVWILTTTGMLILKVEYAPLLGFMIGLFNMIPFIGAIIGVGIAVLVTLLTGGFGKALAMLIVVLILQQIDANIINPRILKGTLKSSPLLTLFSITIGGACFGIIGMFLAVPIGVVIKAMMTDFVDNKNKIRDMEEKLN